MIGGDVERHHSRELRYRDRVTALHADLMHSDAGIPIPGCVVKPGAVRHESLCWRTAGDLQDSLYPGRLRACQPSHARGKRGDHGGRADQRPEVALQTLPRCRNELIRSARAGNSLGNIGAAEVAAGIQKLLCGLEPPLRLFFQQSHDHSIQFG